MNTATKIYFACLIIVVGLGLYAVRPSKCKYCGGRVKYNGYFDACTNPKCGKRKR